MYQAYYITPPVYDAATVSMPLGEAPPSPAASQVSVAESSIGSSSASTSAVSPEIATLQADAAQAKEEMAKINTNMAGMLATLQDMKRARE